MNFINSRRHRNFSSLFSFLNAAMLAPAIVLATFGALYAAAEADGNRNSRENKRISPLVSRRTAAAEKDFGLFMFPTKHSTPIFSASESLLEDLLEGDLDTSFGSGGKVTTQIGNSKSEALAVAVQSDGKFVAAGYAFNGTNNDFALVRYNSTGSLDRSAFGFGGIVRTDIGNAENVSLAVAIQPADGKIIAAGSSFNGADNDFALVRYKTDGALDETFGTGGIVTTNFGNSYEYIDAVAVQPDGKIVAAGEVFNGSYFDFAVVRYNSNGTLDSSFGSSGRVTTDFTQLDDLARAIALQADGKIVVAGEANGDFGVARYNSNGTLDATFDGDGKAVTSVNLFDSAYDVAVQPEGKIVAAGEAGDGTNSDFAVVRYNADGSLDASFGAGGKVSTAIGSSDEFASSLTLQPNGKIIVGGFSYNGSNDDFALVRYNTNGTLDSSFGTGGKITTNFSASSYDYISALATQSSKLIAVGSSNSTFAAASYYLGASGVCSYTLSATAVTVALAGGTGEFTVTTSAGCSRTAVSNDSFVTITNGNSSTGSGTISFTVAAASAARVGTITVGNQTFTINQTSAKARKRVRVVEF